MSGYKPYILIHDFYYEKPFTVVRERIEYEYDLRRMIKNIKNITDGKCKIIRTSKLTSKPKNTKKFIEIIYTSYIPYCIKITDVWYSKVANDRLNMLHHLRHLLGYFLVNLLPVKKIGFSLVWEGRKQFWINKDDYLAEEIKNSLFFIIGRTIRDSRGNPIETRDITGSINFTDSEEEICKKVQEADDLVLRTISKNILFPDKKCEVWNTETLKENVVEGIIRFKKEKKLE